MDNDTRIAEEGDDEGKDFQEEQQQGKGMAPALILVHPRGRFIIAVIGAAFRVFDVEFNVPISPIDNTNPSGHGDAIRAAAFDSSGDYFASAADDKLVKLWTVSTWTCLKTIRANKKVSAVSFSRDGKWLLFADKFGVVYVVPTIKDEEDPTKKEEPIQLLAHCCSIITGLEISPCGKFIATSDRDFKIRISVFPSHPLSGAHEIQSYCLGHTSFVSCISFLRDESSSRTLLVSGGGDATIRLWDHSDGSLLNTFDLSQIDGVVDDSGNVPAVIKISVSNSHIAALVESYAGVLLLNCDIQLKRLQLLQKVALPELICPTSLQFEKGQERLLLIAGAVETREVGDRVVDGKVAAELKLQAQAASANAVACVRVLERKEDAMALGEYSYTLLRDEDVHGGEGLLMALQGKQHSDSCAAAATAAAQAAEVAMKNLLSKRQYTQDHMNNRKRFRNDKKQSAKASE